MRIKSPFRSEVWITLNTLLSLLTVCRKPQAQSLTIRSRGWMFFWPMSISPRGATICHFGTIQFCFPKAKELNSSDCHEKKIVFSIRLFQLTRSARVCPLFERGVANGFQFQTSDLTL